MEDKRKILGTLIGILGFIAAMAGLTYAMYTASITNNNTVTGGHECININYTKGTDISGSELNFVDTYQEGVSTEITFYQASNCGNNIGTIYINTSEDSSDSLITGITTNDQTHGVLKYTIEKKSSEGAVTATYEGYITQKGDTAIDIGQLENTTTTYTIYLWLEIDATGNITNDTISGATYSGYIHAAARQGSTFIE